MKYRVSFYRRDEVVDSRTPRYMEDIEANTRAEAISVVKGKDGDIVVRSVYRAPDFPIRKKPSYIFLTSDARNKWYRSRLCHICKENKVERYKRICQECMNKRETNLEKTCISCNSSLPADEGNHRSRRRYCEACSAKRRESQEKSHREKKAKQLTIERIKEQIAWAEEALKTTTLMNCKFAYRYQGLRVPHFKENSRRCRTCLKKFIDVQTVYLSNLIVGEPEDEISINSIMEVEHASYATAGV